MILTIYRLKIPCFALLVTLITSSQVLATEAKGLVRILTVGNSFTNNATELLEKLQRAVAGNLSINDFTLVDPH